MLKALIFDYDIMYVVQKRYDVHSASRSYDVYYLVDDTIKRSILINYINS